MLPGTSWPLRSQITLRDSCSDPIVVFVLDSLALENHSLATVIKQFGITSFSGVHPQEGRTGFRGIAGKRHALTAIDFLLDLVVMRSSTELSVVLTIAG